MKELKSNELVGAEDILRKLQELCGEMYSCVVKLVLKD